MPIPPAAHYISCPLQTHLLYWHDDRLGEYYYSAELRSSFQQLSVRVSFVVRWLEWVSRDLQLCVNK